jgi:hypothetical protein
MRLEWYREFESPLEEGRLVEAMTSYRINRGLAARRAVIRRAAAALIRLVAERYCDRITTQYGALHRVAALFDRDEEPTAAQWVEAQRELRWTTQIAHRFETDLLTRYSASEACGKVAGVLDTGRIHDLIGLALIGESDYADAFIRQMGGDAVTRAEDARRRNEQADADDEDA